MANKGVLVRCLGVGEEHTFYSRDKCRNRICPRCSKILAGIRVPPREENVIDIPPGPTRDSIRRNK